MDIQRSLKILELGEGASEEEVRQAYKDIVSVWHPDRFPNNPRLRKKAENKLKEINLAYETLLSFFRSVRCPAGSNAQPRPFTSGSAGTEGPSQGTRTTDREGSKTELAAELATTAVLDLWSLISMKFNQFIEDRDTEGEVDEEMEPLGKSRK